MKFTTFLKVFAISLAVFIGACGIGVGILAIAGYFSTPQVMPQDLVFDQAEYNVDDDFTITISTTTQDVSETTLTLSLQNGNIITASDGSVRISDGVISIPQTATIGVPFDVYLETTAHDDECNGEEWITGGHSIITATSQNQQINSISANVNVDVPVYRVELETRVSAQDDNSDIFAVGSSINASLKFYPARSAYQYSHDGTDGGEVVYKNTYFMTASSTDENITQQGHTNVFATNRIGTSTIVGYVFASTPIEERVLLGYQNLDEDARYSAVLARLEQMSSDTTGQDRQAYRSNKTIEIVEVEVDSMRLDGGIGNVDVDTLFTLYANNSNIAQTSSQSNLGIRLYSSLDQSISLQHELSSVAIRFLYKVGNTYYDAVNNENSAYNVVTIPSYGHGETRQVVVDGETYTYYFPYITQSIDEYFWQFAVTSDVDSNNLCIEVRYFGETADDVEPITVNFSTNAVQDSSIYWSTTNQTLTIIDGKNPDLNSLDVWSLAVVPSANLYQRRAYFVVSSGEFNVNDLIVTTGDAVDYQLGSQTVSLYEIEDGIIQPRTTQAYGRTFDVVFMTIQTDYQGNPKLDEQGRYIIQRYSQDSLNAISTLEVYVDKTLYGLTTNIQTALENDELIINDATNDIAYVQNTTAPFEVVIGYSLPASAGQSEQTNEKLIFRNAVLSDDIYVVAKITDSGSETSLIYSTSRTEQQDGTEFVFSMDIGSLPSNVSERRIELFVVYDNDAFLSPREYRISTYNDGQQFECIEVYDGSAEVFDFNINLAEDGSYQSSADNRILVTSNIQSENGYINNIQTTYTLGGNDVSQYLFENDGQNIDYSSLAVVLQDKYGNTPISSDYTLESSNTSILTVTNGTFTFNGTGDVEVYLRDSDGVIQDTLYFSCQQNGYVSKVDRLVESVAGTAATKNTTTVFDSSVSGSNYTFPQISIPLVGYSGSTINLKSTNAGVLNLITYTYTYNNGEGFLTNLANFSLVDEQDMETLDGYIEFGGNATNLTSLQILRDFGRSYSLQLLVTVPVLGISQIIVLDISPNVYLSVDSYGNDYTDEPISSVGNVTYLGAYSDSLYQVRIQLNYIVGTGSDDFSLDNSQYSLYLYEYDKEGQQIGDRIALGTDSTNSSAYIANFTASDGSPVTGNAVGRGDGAVQSYIYNANIVFKSSTENNGYRRVMLALEKNNEQNTTIDTVGSLYLYINPNVRAKQNSNEILLNVANGNVNNNNYYGQGVILGEDQQSPLNIARVAGDFAIDYAQVGFRFVNEGDSTRFYITRNGTENEFILYSLANITNSTTLSLVMTYNGVDVLTSDGETYEINFTLRPNITRNPDSTMWVLYKGEYYLKLVNDETYTFDTILDAFVVVDDGSTTITKNLEIESTNNIVVQGQNIQIQGVNNNIIDSEIGILTLSNGDSSNGDSIEFNILLLPFDIPYVIYPNALDVEYDLYNLLDIDYIVDEGLYYTLEGAGLEGTDILIETDEEITDGVYGIRYVSGMQLSVRNLDESDRNIYAYFEGTNLITQPVGRDTFIIVEARLNLASDSLVIPYLIQIKKVLDIHIYYPYTTAFSQNTNLSGSALYGNVQDITFDIEYLSFAENGTASVDLLEKFDDLIPNSTNGSQRVVIGRISDGTFTEMEDNMPSLTLTFTISEVAYYYYGWQTAANPGQYASISSGIHGNSVININRGGAQYVRVKVQMTTQNGLEAYYYISVGEIPTLNFTERTSGGVYSPDIQDISLEDVANGEPIGNGKYNLTMSIGSSSSTTNANDLLSYHIVPTGNEGQNAWIDYDTMTLYAEDTTENWNTQFVFYTKYGVLDVVNLYISSNYDIGLIEPNDSNLTYNARDGVYEIDSGNIIDINSTFQIIKNDGESTFTTFDDITVEIVTSIDNSIIVAQEIEGEDIIKVGLVTQDTDVNISIVFSFTDNGEQVTYNFSMTLRIHSTLSIGTAPNGQPITQINMYPVSDISAGETTNLDILSALFEFSGSLDFDTWYANLITNGLGSLTVELITQNVYGDFSGNVIAENGHYVIALDASEVANSTSLSFRVSYYNTLTDGDETLVMTSYFNFTLEPNFLIVTNYPTPNDDVVAVAESYWFDTTENAQNIISLVDTADLSEAERVVVQDLNGQGHQGNIYIQVGLGAEYIYVNNAQAGIGFYSLDTEFEIRQDTASISDGTSLQFGLYYKIDGENGEDYIPVGVYNVVVFLGTVYELHGYNYNSSISTNSSNNLENIYIGTNDDILTKIRLTLTVPKDADLSTTKYLSVDSVNGVNAESSLITLAEGMQGDEISVFVTLLNLNVGDMNAFVSSEAGVIFSVYTLGTDGEYIGSTLTNEEGASVVEEILVSFESRIQLSYRTVTSFDSQGGSATTSTQNIEFFKQYALLSGTNCTLQNEDITQGSIISKSIRINSRNGNSVTDGIQIGTYYVNYDFDIEFEQTEVSLTAGQNTSVLHNGTSANSNYLSLLNMKRRSNGEYYTPEDFSSDGLQLSIDSDSITYTATDSQYQDLVNRYTGYLRNTPTTSGEGASEYTYDFNFMAMGSPRETSVTVSLVLTVTYSNSITEEIPLTFIVSHDYTNETLRNSDGTTNSEINRNNIRDYNFTQYLNFAIWGSETPTDNFIFIEHTNETQNQTGNIAPMFDVSYDQGSEYVLKRSQTSTSYDLAFRFTDSTFGDKNVDIVLTDAYGYTIRYYVTIVAQYNIVFNTGSITAFERDSIGLVDQRDGAMDYDHTISVAFTKRDSSLNDYFLINLAPWVATFTFDNVNEKYELTSENNQYHFDIDFIDSKYFNGGNSITGTLNLSATSDKGDKVSIDIPMTIRERYSLVSSDTPYVRDGVAFSLLDVIDVVDNSQNYVVGERTIEDSYTIYLDYTITNGEGQQLSLSDVSNVLSIRIRAYNIQTNQAVYATVPIDSETKYLSIADLFGFEDISNYQFRVGYVITKYEYSKDDNEGHNITGTTSTQHDFSYTSSSSTLTYDISYETSSGHKGVSTPVVFENSYYDGEGEFPPSWPQYTLQIQECYIIEDQILTIGMRQLDNNSQITVHFVNQENSDDRRQVNLSANTNSMVSYSLRELGVIDTLRGEKVSLLTDREDTIIEGLSVTQWANLKGISFEDSSSEDGDTVQNDYNMTKYIEPNPTFETSTDGLNIEYVEDSLNINVNYAYENGVAQKTREDFTADVWITLKFIDVDSTLAYGSGQSRSAELPSNYDEGISVSDWAGTTYRPFELVAGYTTATAFVSGDDTTLSGNSGDLEFAINTVSAGSQFVSIDPDTGTITLHDGFNINTNYILIDVYCKYGENGSAGEKLIDTVRVYFVDPTENQNLRITANTSRLPKVTSETQNAAFDVLESDILQMITISSDSSSWTGQEILDTFGIEIGLYTSRSLNAGGTYDYAWITNGMQTLLSGDSRIAIQNNVTSANLRVLPTRNGVLYDELILSNIQFVDSRYTANSMASSSNYQYQGSVDVSSIFNSLFDSIAVRNIYGNIDRGNAIFNLSETDLDNPYEALKSLNVTASEPQSQGVVTTIEYTIGENLNESNSIVYGTITVDVYSDADTISGSKTVDLTSGNALNDVINSDLFDFNSMPVYGYHKIEISADEEDPDAQPSYEYYIYISSDAFNKIVSSDFELLDISEITMYQNGRKIASNAVADGQATISNFTFIINNAGIEILFADGNYSQYFNDILSLTITNGDESYNYSFLFINQEVPVAGQEASSTYISRYTDIFTLLTYINGVDASDIYVRLSENNQYVSLVNNDGDYSLLLLNSASSQSEITVTVEFYITIFDFNPDSSQDIVLYRNTITINATQKQGE